MRLMGSGDFGHLPVVERTNPRHLLGILRRTDLVRAYDLALRKRSLIRHRENVVRLNAISDEKVRIQEIVVQPGAPAAGKHIKDAGWPECSIISSVRRGQRVLVPNGSTLIQVGDLLVVAVEIHEQTEVQRLCQTEDID